MSDLSVEGPRVSDHTDEVPPWPVIMPAWREWSPEQLWLWSNPMIPAVRARMRAALATAVSTLPDQDIECIAAHAERNDPGSALRLTARLLRATGTDQRARDLASCALLLAVLEHQDERAAIELTVLVSLRAARISGRWRDHYSYPPPLNQPRRLRARMMHRGGLAVVLLAGRTGWARAVREIGLVATDDPLSDVSTSGRKISGWDRR